MKSLFKSLAVVAIVFGLTLGVQAVASAQHGHGGHGHGGHRHGHSHGGYQRGGLSIQFGGGNFGGYYRPSYPTFHDTSHFDYHPGGYQRHGYHYHYVPGHYDYHQSGHWHR